MRWKKVAHVAIDIVVGIAMVSFVATFGSHSVNDDGWELRSLDLLLAIAAAWMYVRAITTHVRRHHHRRTWSAHS